MICDDFIAKAKLDIAGITLQFDDIDDGLMINVQSSGHHFFQANNSCVALVIVLLNVVPMKVFLLVLYYL